MAPPFRFRVHAAAAKTEAVAGTYTEPSWATDTLLLVGTPTLEIQNLVSGARDDVQNGQLLTLPRAAQAGRFATLQIVLEATGGTNAAPPYYEELLLGSGFEKTVSAPAVLYTTTDFTVSPFSLIILSGLKLFRLSGCVCTWQFAVDVAGIPRWTFSVTGKLLPTVDPGGGAVANPIQLASPPVITYPSLLPQPWHSNTVIFGPTGTPEWSTASAQPMLPISLAINDNGTIADRAGAGQVDGLHSFLITDRRTSMTMTVEQVDLSQFDPYDIARADGTGAGGSASHDIRTQINIGQSSTRRWRIDTGYWQLGQPTTGDRNGLATWELSGPLSALNGPTGSGGAREIQFRAD